MKLPENITKKEKIYLKETYRAFYAKNLNKGKEKASRLATAKLYEECFKIFCKKEKITTIREEWLSKKFLTESVDYKTYELGKVKFVVSTDEKILKKFSSEKKGLIRDMNDEYEQEILFKVKSKYGIRLHPDMYYVIK